MAPARWWIGVVVLVVPSLLLPRGTRAQDLADLDYENLAFRGFGFEAGYMWPTRVDRSIALGARFDLGYAGPGLRIMPHVSYWSSPLRDREVTQLETRMLDLVEAQTGTRPLALNLGPIDWRDVAVGVDAHIVWDSLFDLLTYGGLGVTAHVMDGSSDEINGTLIDDLLDSVTAGFNLHFGMEYPLTERFRAYGVAKYEVMSDLQYFQLRAGWQIMTGPNAPGEGR